MLNCIVVVVVFVFFTNQKSCLIPFDFLTPCTCRLNVKPNFVFLLVIRRDSGISCSFGFKSRERSWVRTTRTRSYYKLSNVWMR